MENENKKDLYDEVINEMDTNNGHHCDETCECCHHDDNSTTDDAIQLKLSTGEVFLVDAKTFDWDNAITKLASMIDNEDAIRNIEFRLLNITDPTTEEASEYIKATIVQLADFMKGFEIVPSYEQFDPNMNDYKKALIMTFDTNNIVRTMIHNTEMYELISNISDIANFRESSFGECDCDECSGHDECDLPDGSDSGYTIYKVTGVGEPDNIRIKDIIEEDTSPDNIGIVDYDPTDKEYTVYVYDNLTYSALEEAQKYFKDFSMM